MSKLWEKVMRRALFSLDAERAHELGIRGLESGLARPFTSQFEHKSLEVERFGLKFPNPLGMAAGFDKNGRVVNQLASIGFGFVEVGTITFEPQAGNPKPRMFRLPEDGGLINRLGFNNEGAAVVAGRLRKLDRKCIVGVNIGKNKEISNDDAVSNYLAAFDEVFDVADYIAVNISSPNTPNLRELQRAENLDIFIGALQEQNQKKGGKPLLIKIAPDLKVADIERIVDTCMRFGISGIVATNTTIGRENLISRDVDSIGSGGLSGMPLRERSTEVIRHIYRTSKGKLPIVGVGGIFTAEDAFEKLAAGASLVQAYTGFVYGGPTFACDINRGLVVLMNERGFASVDEVVGSSAGV